MGGTSWNPHGPISIIRAKFPDLATRISQEVNFLYRIILPDVIDILRKILHEERLRTVYFLSKCRYVASRGMRSLAQHMEAELTRKHGKYAQVGSED